jgi:superfamily I DNA/RNA helicase
LIGGQSYFDRREIKDFLAYLKLLVNPHDDASLLRVANVPPRGLSEATMERLLAASHDQKSSVYTAMLNSAAKSTLPPRAQESVAGFAAWIERTRAPLSGQKLSLANWAERWVNEIGYFDDLRRSEKDPEAGESRIRNLRDLIATLNGSGGAELPIERLQTFLEDLTLDTEREEKGPEGEAVTLITMHSCKGLEFPHVYIVGLEDGLLPHARSKEEGTLDEERRLFYVAITRAMRTLRLSYCTGRKKYGQSLPCYPSPFLKELPNHLLELADERGKKPVPIESGKMMFANLRAALG